LVAGGVAEDPDQVIGSGAQLAGVAGGDESDY